MDNFERGNKLFKCEDYIAAIEEYKLCQDNYNEVACLYNIGTCYIKLKQWEDAILYIKKAIRLREKSEYYFNLGYCYAKLKQNQKSIEYFKRSLELNPYDDDAKRAIKQLGGEVKEPSISMIEDDNYADINLITIDEKLNILMLKINNSLDNRDKTLFAELVNEYNKYDKIRKEVK